MAYLDPSGGKAREGKQTAAVANAGAATAAAAAGANPTKAEFDALLTDVNALRTKINALLAAMRTSGQLAP
ncbi:MULTISPECIES: hypothetical protein [Streptomyces]|jgi:hypothetical protein|uniref:Uncharacterized protein n=1 Tax=Streptomyces scabiei TaxID=1930 RepID=A0A124C4C8_STRSC|nr:MULTISPECIES: hypothetical protein [Streptomyces]MDX2616141.1 hypothetical protein [Streptomyces stelliscabiei]MDX2634171.1 hypothetical protein [Streptomyces stelliscabiei]MDX2664618.1 hypothetical protein [Streptomyces stelliscabiei]MDX2713819.1 hypothetical protein [Streptomyces stelliscabiei]MDX2785785.1 hypothetical protein [Streptomyces stelliscabiei]